MNLELSSEQQLLRETVRRLLGDLSTPARIRACEPLGFDGELWNALWEMEIPRLRVPGESDASLMHAILVAEECGHHLASAPLPEAIVAQRLLAQLGCLDVTRRHKVANDHAVVSLALHDLQVKPDQLLASGAVGDVVIGLEGETLWMLGMLERDEMTVHGSIPACRLSAVRVGVRTRLDHPDAARLFREAIEELQLLNAAQVVGAGLQTVQSAADYAGERAAFGRKIGEFQGVSHPLADSFTDLEGALLLCWRAADAISRKDFTAGALIAMAAWWSGIAARRAALRAMRVLGGYGMAMEYDAQLYFRRINGWSLCAGTPDADLDRVANRLWGRSTIDLPDAGEVVIDFGWGAEAEAAATRMRAFCEARNNPQMQHFMHRSLDGFDLSLQRAMADEGLLYPDAPVEYGGPGLSLSAAAAVRDVYGDYYWNMLAPSVSDMIAKTVLHFGTEETKRAVLPGIYSGETYCTLGYSEPSGGSDIFAARTTARRDETPGSTDWLVNGQKMFTSTAHLAEYALMVLRTGPDKYRGLTIFMVPIRQPGFELTEIKTIGDERTNVTFYNDVRVPDAYRIGEVDGGSKVLAAALAIEQSSGDLHVMSLKYLLKGSLEWARDPARPDAPIQRAEVRRALAETATRLTIQDALNRRGVWACETKQPKKHHGPMAKLFGSESWLACSARLMEVAAPESLVLQQEAEGVMEFMLRRAIPATIYAGTSEVQRSLIAEAGLGMPRSR